jgi:hypothetical protein
MIPDEIQEAVVAAARRDVCEYLSMPEEDFEQDVVEVAVEEQPGPWHVMFLVKNQGKMLYRVDVDPHVAWEMAQREEHGDPVDTSRPKVRVKAKNEAKARKNLPKADLGRIWVLTSKD